MGQWGDKGRGAGAGMAGEGPRGFPACGQTASRCVPVPVPRKGREEGNGVVLDPAWLWTVWIWDG